MSSSLIFDWSALQQSTEGLGTGGVIRQAPDDFCVEEVPIYLPAGAGEHLYLKVAKREHSTAHVIQELSKQLGIKDRHIGVAGLKDRHAFTVQWLSIPAKYEKRLKDFAVAGVDILETGLHGNKLGMGHLQGNYFAVRVRQAAGQATRATELLELLHKNGIPNYFGPQRFGLGGLNATEGLRVLRGESQLKNPRLTRFLVSSVQSALFNEWVSRRLALGVFDALILGDMAKKHDTGGVFLVEDAEAETPRAQRNEVSATGTLFGRKTKPLTLEAGTLETEILRDFDLQLSLFQGRHGDRRLTRVFPDRVGVEATEDGFWLRFMLPKGSFATSVLREVLKTKVDMEPLPLDDRTVTTERAEAKQEEDKEAEERVTP